MQRNLFKETTPETWEQKYKKVLASKRWRSMRSRRIATTGRRCEVCRSIVPEWSEGVRLELHHKHYETLGRESDTDVVLVCSVCHKQEDAKRERASKHKSERRLYESRFLGWFDKVYADQYGEPEEWMEDEFNDWLDSLD